MSDNEKGLVGRVAKILNANELVINIGSADGVRRGMKFDVLSESPIEIRDPETDEVLDSIDREKVRVEASTVKERITICKTYRITRTPGMLSVRGITALMGESREVQETLRIEDSAIPPPLSEEESYVKVRDRVIQVDSSPTAS